MVIPINSYWGGGSFIEEVGDGVVDLVVDILSGPYNGSNLLTLVKKIPMMCPYIWRRKAHLCSSWQCILKLKVLTAHEFRNEFSNETQLLVIPPPPPPGDPA